VQGRRNFLTSFRRITRLIIRLLVSILVFVINTVYRDRAYPRFYVLETVARVPYFSYLSVLQLHDTDKN